jgi:hypothetical protein
LGLIIEGLSEWMCKSLDSLPATPGIDEASMHILQAASSVVQPFKMFYTSQYPVSGFPLTTAALLRWASPVLHGSLFRKEHSSLPSLWQALQCCSKLQQVVLCLGYSIGECIDDIGLHVQLAAEHLVAVVRRPLVLEMVCTTENPAEDGPLLCRLKHDLQQIVPSSVRVQECTWEIDEEEREDSRAADLIIKLSPAP